jgi:serine/threonine protein kinase
MRCDLGFANKELKLVEGSKLFICTQIAHVLVEIEGRIIHGDLKPSNILLDGDNNINVIGIDCNEALDFGMSRILSKAHNHLVESNSHTYLYSPPEQVLQKSAHAKSDIWSFGIIMFELFTNRQMSQDIIYEMGMYDENRKGNLHIKLSPKDALHKGIYELIELMTNFNYEERPSARDIWAKLHHMQQHYHAPPSPTVQAIPIHNKQKPPPVKKSDSKQNLLMVQGK